jgi:undecaprenyl-diphosphatase
MSKYLEVMIRGCVQGLSEFLPISSSGHLLLLSKFGFTEQPLLYDIFLHVATLLVIIIVFRKSIIAILKDPLGDKAKFVIIASIPTAILAGVIRYFLYEYSMQMLPFCFMLTTVILFSTRYARNINMLLKWDNGYPKCALIVGVFQGIACLSGVSRSGLTVSAMKHLGMKNEESSELTFLLSIPIIIGSAIVELLCYEGTGNIVLSELIIGMIFAFLSGLLAVNSFIKILNKGKIWLFSFYTFLASIVSFYVIYFC